MTTAAQRLTDLIAAANTERAALGLPALTEATWALLAEAWERAADREAEQDAEAANLQAKADRLRELTEPAPTTEGMEVTEIETIDLDWVPEEPAQ